MVFRSHAPSRRGGTFLIWSTTTSARGWVQAPAQAVGGGANLCLAGAEPAAVQGLRSAVRLPCTEPPGERGLGLSGHATPVREAAGQGRVASVQGFYDSLLHNPVGPRAWGVRGGAGRQKKHEHDVGIAQDKHTCAALYGEGRVSAVRGSSCVTGSKSGGWGKRPGPGSSGSRRAPQAAGRGEPRSRPPGFLPSREAG